MPLARCIAKCWDSQATKLYYPGNVAELPEDHVFLKGKIKCFEPITAQELAKTSENTDAKILQMTILIADLTKRLGELEPKKPEVPMEPLKEEVKRGPGRPSNPKE